MPVQAMSANASHPSQVTSAAMSEAAECTAFLVSCHCAVLFGVSVASRIYHPAKGSRMQVSYTSTMPAPQESCTVGRMLNFGKANKANLGRRKGLPSRLDALLDSPKGFTFARCKNVIFCL